jgi:hypothetical protein
VAIAGYNHALCTGESTPLVSVRNRWTHWVESGIQTSGSVTSGLASAGSSLAELVLCTLTVMHAPSTAGRPAVQCVATSWSTELIDGAATTDKDTAAVHGPVLAAALGGEDGRDRTTSAVTPTATAATTTSTSAVMNPGRRARGARA